MNALKQWITQWADKEGSRPLVILWLGVGVTLLFFVAAGVSVWVADLNMIRTEEQASQLSSRVTEILYNAEKSTETIRRAVDKREGMLPDSNTDEIASIAESFATIRSLEQEIHVSGSTLELQDARTRLAALQNSALRLVAAGEWEKARVTLSDSSCAELEQTMHESARNATRLATLQSAGANRVFTARLWWISIVAAIFFVALNVAWLAVMRLLGAQLAERRKAATELRESEEKYRALIDALPHAVLIAQDGKFVFCNPSAATTFGYDTPQEMAGVACLDVVAERDQERAASLIAARARGETKVPLHHNLALQRRTGEEFSAEVFVRSMLLRGREATQYVLRDVSESQKADFALRESEEKYRSLIEKLPHSVLIFQDDIVVFCNPAAALTLGYLRTADVVGLNRAVFMPTSARDRLNACINARQTGETDASDHCLVNLLRRNQDEFPAEIVVQQITYGSRPALQVLILDVTERQRAEHALRESEERFRNLSDTAPVLIWMAGSARHTFYFNKTWLKFTGRSVGLEYGHGWKQGVHPDDLPRCMTVFDNAFKSRAPFTVEYRLRHADGTDHWVLDTGVPRFTADGSFTGFIGSCVDITTRRTTEEALRESERQFRNLADFLPHTIFESDENGRIIFANRRGFETFGYTVQEIERGVDILDMLAVNDRARARENIIRSFQGEQMPGKEYMARRKDGTLFPVAVDTSVREVDGKIRGLRGMVIDISERKHAEAMLREQSAALCAAMDGMAILDTNERYVFVNDAHARLYGYASGQELIGQSWEMLYDETELRRFKQEIMPRFREEGRWQGAAIGKRRDGSRFRQELSLSRTETGGLVCIVRHLCEGASKEELQSALAEVLRFGADSSDVTELVSKIEMRLESLRTLTGANEEAGGYRS